MEIILRRPDKISKLVYIDVDGTTCDAVCITDSDFESRVMMNISKMIEP